MFVKMVESGAATMSCVSKCTIIMYMLCVINAQVPMLIKGGQVPCVFFLGDSQMDNGNNNFLKTSAKANYMPYGIDYPDGPTGRFTNGRNIADFIAELLGFDKPIPAFATARDPQLLKGVNYGSGASGILDESGFAQVMNHAMTVHRIGELLGNPRKAKEHLTNCLYCINVGSNDYLNNYFMRQNTTRPSSSSSPAHFAALLSRLYSQQLRSLYSLGARRIAIFGVGQVGYVPQITSMLHGSSRGCIELFNNDAQLFSNTLPPLVDALNHDLPDAKFIVINATSISNVDPLVSGIKIVDAPCCVVRKETGLCKEGSEPCRNRNEHAFWDNIHPSENLYRDMAKRAYHAESPFDAYPTDIRTLVRKN